MSSYCVWRGVASDPPVAKVLTWSFCRLTLMGVSVSLYVLHSTSLFGSCCSLFAYRRSEQKDRHVISSAVCCQWRGFSSDWSFGIVMTPSLTSKLIMTRDIYAIVDHDRVADELNIGVWGQTKLKKQREREASSIDNVVIYWLSY